MSRDPVVDVARGIGIVLVVLGHSQLIGLIAHGHAWLYSFHMPLFLFLSGLFISQSAPVAVFLRGRIDVILKPYFVMGVVISIVAAALAARHGADFASGALARLEGIVYGIGATQVWTPMWFLPFIFCVSVGAWAVVRLTVGARMAIAVVAAVAYVVGVALLGNPLPWSLDIAPIGVAWALAGWLSYPAFRGRQASAAVALMGFAALLALTAVVIGTGAETNLSRRTMTDPAVATLCAVLGVAAVMAFSLWLARFGVIARALGYVGERTLFILIFHDPIQWEVFSRVSRLAGVPIALVFGFVAGIGLPLLIHEIVSRSPVRALLLPAHRKS